MTRRELLWVPLAAATTAATQRVRLEIASRRLHLDRTLNGIDAARFVMMLNDSRVRAITVVAKGAAGNGYDSPQLGGLIGACKQAGIEAVYSYSLACDTLQAARHPEWMTVGDHPPGWLCLNSPYLDQVLRENREIVSKFPVSGAYFDNLLIPESGCFCQWCMADRKRLGISAIAPHTTIVAKRVEKALAGLVPGTVFFEGRPRTALRGEIDAFTHLEIEADFEYQIHYLRTLGRDCVGVIRQPPGLEAACLQRVANGAKVCIRVPSPERFDGELRATYRKLEALEKWTQGCRAVADIGVLMTSPAADRRVSAILTELHQQFDLVDNQSDFALYKLIICPDLANPPDRLVALLEPYVNRGGALLISRMNLDGQQAFAQHILGVSSQAPAPARGEVVFKDVLASVSATFDRPLEAIRAARGTEVLATYGGAPLITQKNSAAYVTAELFQPTRKAVIRELIRLLLTRPSVIAPNLPETAQVTMLEQRTQGNLRRIVHVMHYGTDGKPAPLENVQLSVSLPQHPLGVVLIPSEQPLEFKHNEFYTTFTLPRVLGHQAIAFE